MAHKVTAPLVTVKDPSGKITYFYEGATVPDGYDKADLARLVEARLIEEVIQEPDENAPVEVPAGDPSDAWTVKQLKAFAEAKGIDLGDAKSKGDVLSVLVK